MRQAILSILGAAMLCACGSAPVQSTIPEQPVPAHEPVQHVDDYLTEQREGLAIRQCAMGGYRLMSSARQPTGQQFDRVRYPESLVSMFDSNNDFRPDTITYRYISPQGPAASGPYLYIRTQHKPGQQIEVMTTYDFRLDCLNGNEESVTQRISPPQERREQRRLPQRTIVPLSLDLESHL